MPENMACRKIWERFYRTVVHTSPYQFQFFLTILTSLSTAVPSPQKKGSFSYDDGDGHENVKTAIGLLSKTTSLHVHHAFLYTSLPLLHDYDVKMPNVKFYGGRLSLSKIECGP